MTYTPFCPKLREKKEEIEKSLKELRDLIEKYKKSGKEEGYLQAKKEIEEREKEEKKFLEEYQEKIIFLLKDWYQKTTRRGINDVSEFLSQIKFEEDGRVKIKRINLAYLSLKLFYLPKLLNVEILDCSHNQLSKLPELPEGLEKLNCSFNQLSKLPELPEGLEELRCFDNFLDREELEKIKKHKNYNEKWGIYPQNI